MDFCYPSGRYNEEVVKTVKKYGYLTAVTTDEGFANNQSNIFKLRRLRITNETLFDRLLRK
jgi:hypothetical protein